MRGEDNSPPVQHVGPFTFMRHYHAPHLRPSPQVYVQVSAQSGESRHWVTEVVVFTWEKQMGNKVASIPHAFGLER
jgi:hypothetical protein